MKGQEENFDNLFVEIVNYGINKNTLEGAAKIIRSTSAAHLFFERGKNVGVNEYNVPRSAEEAYNSEIGDRDPYVPILFKNPNIEVFHARSLYPLTSIADREFIGEVYEPMGTTDILALTLHAGNNFHALTLPTSRKNGYESEDVKIAGLLYGNIRRALHVGRQKIFNPSNVAPPSLVSCANFLLLGGVVQSMNSEAEYLARGGVVSIDVMNYLRFCSPIVDCKLREVLRGHAVEGRASIRTPAYDRLSVSICRLPQRPIAFALSDSSMILVTIENLERELDVELLNSAYSLTETEQKIARIALEGIAPLEIARRVGRKKTTVDFHLENLRDKLGVSSHPSLLAMLQKFTRRASIIPAR